jgi:uncharacterized membrane protein
MKKYLRLATGLVFLIITLSVLTTTRINPPASSPTRSNETRMAGIMEGMVKGIIITQQITAIKDYMTGIELIFSHAGRNNTNENTFILLDTSYNVLYRRDFSSSGVTDGAPTSFLFPKPIAVGKGNPLILCLYSNDGTQNNTLNLLMNQADSLGPLYISNATGDDLTSSLKNKVRRYRGSLMLRTYETAQSQFWFLKYLLGGIALLIALVILFFPWLKKQLLKTRIRPEWLFAAIAIPGSTIFAIITPPLQVPDEGGHFLRSYEISELKITDKDRTLPVSLVTLDSAFAHLHFVAGQKTTLEEIKSKSTIRLQPRNRQQVSPPDYTLPYIPQATGILIGKLFSSSTLTLMYFGRIFNLLISIVVLFFAIRMVPLFNWLFFLLAVMPKTLFMFGSLSYDSLTISLTFLAIAVFLRYAWATERNLTIRDLAVMALVTLLLLMCKPPYFLVALLFFFIPRQKFGKMYTYLMGGIAIAVLAIGIVAVRPFVVNHVLKTSAPASASAGQVVTDSTGKTTTRLPVIRPDEQMKIIMSDIPAYLTLVFKSGFVYYRTYLLESFVGILGWIDVELPDILTWSYLLLLLFTALAIASDQIRIPWTHKTLLAVILIAGFILIETAMYLYATKPGRDRVFGVQGRYFIPLAPLFFMLFYNRYLSPALNLLFSPRRKEFRSAKPKVKPAIQAEITGQERIFDRYLQLLMIAFTVIALIYSVYVTLVRYYNI